MYSFISLKIKFVLGVYLNKIFIDFEMFEFKLFVMLIFCL